MKRLLLLFLVVAGAAHGQLSFRDPRWQTVGVGTLAARPATCTANKHVYICNGAGCGTNGEYHYCTAADTWTVMASGSGAPTDATYITKTENGTLSAEVALGSLATGFLKVTTTTGDLASRTITAGAGITVNNGDGASGNPAILLDTAAALTQATAQAGTPWYCNATGGTDSYSCSTTPTITAYSTGMFVVLKPDVANVGATCVDVDAGGPLACISIKSIDTSTDLPDGVLVANKPISITYTGSVFVPIGPVTTSKMWLPAAGCQNTTATLFWDTPTTNAAVAACVTGTNTQKGVADFADAANLSMQMTLMLPSDFTGAMDARFKWLTSATTGSVVWQLSTSCVADAETDDPAFNTASTVVDAAKGTTLQTNDATISSVTITGCAAGELLHIKVQRDSAHASDDLAATARLIGVELTTRRAQ